MWSSKAVWLMPFFIPTIFECRARLTGKLIPDKKTGSPRLFLPFSTGCDKTLQLFQIISQYFILCLKLLSKIVIEAGGKLHPEQQVFIWPVIVVLEDPNFNPGATLPLRSDGSPFSPRQILAGRSSEGGQHCLGPRFKGVE